MNKIIFTDAEQGEIDRNYDLFKKDGGYINPQNLEEIKKYITAKSLNSYAAKMLDNGELEKAHSSLAKSLIIYPLPEASYFLGILNFKNREFKKTLIQLEHFIKGVDIFKESAKNNPILESYFKSSGENLQVLVKRSLYVISQITKNVSVA